jgi:predicted esterase
LPSAHLDWKVGVDDPRAVVLLLHGGRSKGRGAVRSWHGAVLRMLPFVGQLARTGEGQVAVATLRYAVRGWNGSEASPVADARLALEQVAARHPGVPVGLLGHSMGGRVALHLADEPVVHAIAALAPWVERGDRVVGHDDLHVLVMHGTRDRMTSPEASRRYADQLARQGVDVTYERVADSHAMLSRAGHWHRRSAEYLVRHLLAHTGRGSRSLDR